MRLCGIAMALLGVEHVMARWVMRKLCRGSENQCVCSRIDWMSKNMAEAVRCARQRKSRSRTAVRTDSFCIHLELEHHIASLVLPPLLKQP